MRRRLAELLNSATESSRRNKKDLAQLLAAVKHRVTIARRGFAGSTDTWPPIVRKPENDSD